MSDGVAQDQLQAFVRRIESLEDEINALNGDKSEVYKEAKGNGFDTKVLRKVIADRRKDATERNEFDAVYQLYWDAVHGIVRAHVENIEEFDPETGEVGTVAPALADDGQQANIKATPTIHPSEAAMLPQTAGSETAVANSTPGSGAGTVDAGEANWPSEMTTASPANEPETIPPVADPATVVSEAGGGDSAPSLAAIPVADRSQPNPICRDPGDCGVYASWAMPCQVCKAAAAHRSAA